MSITVAAGRQFAEWVPGGGAADQMRVAGTWRLPEMELWDRESIELMGRLYRGPASTERADSGSAQSAAGAALSLT